MNPADVAATSLSKRNGSGDSSGRADGERAAESKPAGSVDALSDAGRRALDRERQQRKELGKQVHALNETVSRLRKELNASKTEISELKLDRLSLLRVLGLERKGSRG